LVAESKCSNVAPLTSYHLIVCLIAGVLASFILLTGEIMGRFARLVDLRKIREEADGLAYASILARIETCRQKIVKLDEETAEGHKSACEQVVEGNSPGPFLFDDFFRGQKVRVKKLEEKIKFAQEEAAVARNVWLASRTKLQQTEKMAEKEVSKSKFEKRHNDNKELDMIGIVQNRLR
jgi:flagellar export protein FliJ